MTTKKSVESEETAPEEPEESENNGAENATDAGIAENFAQEITRIRQEWADTKEALRGVIGNEPTTRRTDATQAQAGATDKADGDTSQSAADQPATKPVEKRPESGHWYWRKRGG